MRNADVKRSPVGKNMYLMWNSRAGRCPGGGVERAGELIVVPTLVLRDTGAAGLGQADTQMPTTIYVTLCRRHLEKSLTRGAAPVLLAAAAVLEASYTNVRAAALGVSHAPHLSCR